MRAQVGLAHETTTESMTCLYVKLRILEILEQWEAARDEVYSLRSPITSFVESSSFHNFLHTTRQDSFENILTVATSK